MCPVHMEVPEALDSMELQMVVSQHGCWDLNSCPLEKHSVLLTAAESSLQNILSFLSYHVFYSSLFKTHNFLYTAL